MRVFPPNAHSHLPKCARLRSRQVGKISVAKSFDSRGKRSGWNEIQAASPFSKGEGRVRVAPKLWCVSETPTPHLSPLPLPRGEAEQRPSNRLLPHYLEMP